MSVPSDYSQFGNEWPLRYGTMALAQFITAKEIPAVTDSKHCHYQIVGNFLAGKWERATYQGRYKSFPVEADEYFYQVAN